MGLAAVGSGGSAPAPSAGLLVGEAMHLVSLWVRYHNSEFQIAIRAVQAISLGFTTTGSGSSTSNLGGATVNGPAWQKVDIVNPTYGLRWAYFEFTGPGGVKSGVFYVGFSNVAGGNHYLDGFDITEELSPGEQPTGYLEFDAPDENSGRWMSVPALRPKVKTGLLRKLFGMDLR